MNRTTPSRETETTLPLLARPLSGRLLSRRTLIGAAVGLGVAAAAGISVAAGPSAGTAKTTTALNLRARSNTSSKVILVIPAGASVTLNGRVQNGFQDVTYKGNHGWAHADFLTQTGGGGTKPPGTAKVHSELNLRAGPSTSHQVLRVMPGGATVTLLGQAQNGFHYVDHNGQAGWAYGDWLLVNGVPLGHGDGQGQSTRKTTTDLNLRAGASLQDKVLLVMPAGATVTVGNAVSNHFVPVTYKGTSGWAHIDYLA